jgi:hypothetical protein
VHHEGTWGSGGAAPVFVNLCSRWAIGLYAPSALRLEKELPVPILWRVAGSGVPRFGGFNPPAKYRSPTSVGNTPVTT